MFKKYFTIIHLFCIMVMKTEEKLLNCHENNVKKRKSKHEKMVFIYILNLFLYFSVFILILIKVLIIVWCVLVVFKI